MTGEHDTFTGMVLLGYTFNVEATEDRRLLQVTITPPAGIHLNPVYGPASAGALEVLDRAVGIASEHWRQMRSPDGEP
jgi:hypothetical protein